MSWRKVWSLVSSVAQSRLLLYECSMPGDFLDVVGLTRPCVHLLAVWLSKMLWWFAKSKDSSPRGGEQLSLRVRRSGVAAAELWPDSLAYLISSRRGDTLDNMSLSVLVLCESLGSSLRALRVLLGEPRGWPCDWLTIIPLFLYDDAKVRWFYDSGDMFFR